ncbi:VOC family protein [Chitinophaga vietnamensis]|uniref:VOC family protein n=1 Tax=Chitinophaga vietnamensis TaxID=2593957 RepID=UPI001177FCE6|nr:VOC family protein [Chitinophaga vietnamensis]
MITSMTHASLYVLDQDSAHDFYVNKLGFRVITDLPMNKEHRWLTVCPPDMQDFQIVLMPIMEGMFSKEMVTLLRDLVSKGTFGIGIFTCRDIYATYEELSAKGVEFTKAPKKEFYGLEAIFKDDSGNWFSLAQLS